MSFSYCSLACGLLYLYMGDVIVWDGSKDILRSAFRNEKRREKHPQNRKRINASVRKDFRTGECSRGPVLYGKEVLGGKQAIKG